MRRTHVHVSDSGSVWIIHEDPYNLEKAEDLEKVTSHKTAGGSPSAPNIDVVLHTEGHADETINLDDSAQNEINHDKDASDS